MRFRNSPALVFAALTILVGATLGTQPARAQTSQAEIRGTVVDQSGAALPGVTVTATHVDTGAVRTTVTSETGVFLMPALPVGSIACSSSSPVSRASMRENLRLAVGQSAVLSFTHDARHRRGNGHRHRRCAARRDAEHRSWPAASPPVRSRICR